MPSTYRDSRQQGDPVVRSRQCTCWPVHESRRPYQWLTLVARIRRSKAPVDSSESMCRIKRLFDSAASLHLVIDFLQRKHVDVELRDLFPQRWCEGAVVGLTGEDVPRCNAHG